VHDLSQVGDIHGTSLLLDSLSFSLLGWSGSRGLGRRFRWGLSRCFRRWESGSTLTLTPQQSSIILSMVDPITIISSRTRLFPFPFPFFVGEGVGALVGDFVGALVGAFVGGGVVFPLPLSKRGESFSPMVDSMTIISSSRTREFPFPFFVGDGVGAFVGGFVGALVGAFVGGGVTLPLPFN